MGNYLSNVYLWDVKYVLFSLMKVKVNQKKQTELTINSSALKIMHILLFPQSTSSERKKSSDDWEKQNNDSIQNAFFSPNPGMLLNYEDIVASSTIDPAQASSFLVEKKLREHKDLKHFIKNNWMAFRADLSLPTLSLFQPMGATLKMDRNGLVYVYIYITLVPHVNTRKTVYDTRVVPILHSMINENPTKELSSSKIEFHGYRITERFHRDLIPERDFWIESPVNLENGPTEFANKSYVANALNFGHIKDRIERFIGCTENGLFDYNQSDIDTFTQSCGDETLAGALILLNFMTLIETKYNRFITYEDYQNFFDDLNYQLHQAKNWSLPLTMRKKENVIHCTRCLFRRFFADVGIMLPEGQARNYGFLLAASRVELYDKCLYTNIPFDRALPEPNIAYMGTTILCKYILHADKELGDKFTPYPRSLVEKYKILSDAAMMQANQSARSSHQEFLLEYYTMVYVNGQNNDLFYPYELRNTWPVDVKELIKEVLENPKERRSDKQKKDNIFELLHNHWVKKKLNHFFGKLIETEKSNSFMEGFEKKIIMEMQKKNIEINEENKIQHLTATFWSDGTGSHSGIYKLNILQAMAIFVAYAPYKNPDPKTDNFASETLHKLIQCNGIKHTVNDSKKTCVRGLFLDGNTSIDKNDKEYDECNKLYSVRILQNKKNI